MAEEDILHLGKDRDLCLSFRVAPVSGQAAARWWLKRRLGKEGLDFGVEVVGQLLEELLGVLVVGPRNLVDAALNAEGQILGHEASLHGLNAHLLEGIAELGELVVVVELGPPGKTARRSRRWGWSRSRHPSGGRGSGGSRCREQPRPRWSYRRGSSGRRSSDRASRSPERWNRTARHRRSSCRPRRTHPCPSWRRRPCRR